ncbi:hypothetical protein [Wolbachia endosymbiont (group A) of Philonthus cognatus]|uniref:hypothetical protein n=1 Tax=Wolbachia endosymbiont (group A) of Philonthus cognatus TaxID=2954046 RepID=UPI002231786B|nr:hypothetical protein [Wolbachia endosymbiont (group A) of Philonthus cognatus]
MLRQDISEVLFSSIKEDDPYRSSKLLQIERWCYAHWKIHEGYGHIRNNFLAQVLSSEDCWEKVNNLHGVKLNRQMVGKKLIAPGSDSNPNPFGTDRYKIACRCCLEEDIIKMFENRKQERNVENEDSLKRLVSNLSYGDPLKTFWSHLIGGYISKLNLKGRHPYEYGLDCAVDRKQAEAVEFFWNKIKSLPEDELSAQKKDEIFMKNAVYTAGGNFGVCSDIFEFFFDQINPDRYPELLRRDLEKNGCYGSLNRMKEMLSFDKYQELFDCLKPSDISEDYYNARLDSIEIQKYSGRYADAAEKLFLHIWTKEGFDSHRALVIDEEVMDSSSYLHRKLLVPWVERGCMKPVWAVLDKLDSNQIKEFMTYKQADYIRSILEQVDNNSLNKFLSYGKSINKNPNQKSIPGPSGDLAEVEVRKTHSQSHIRLGK